jgi:hypothetical protein
LSLWPLCAQHPLGKRLFGPRSYIRYGAKKYLSQPRMSSSPSAFRLSCPDFTLLCYTNYLSLRPPNRGQPGSRSHAATFVNYVYAIQISQ